MDASVEENKAVVLRQEEELFTEGNLDAAEEIYAPGYVGHDPSNHECGSWGPSPAAGAGGG